MKNTIHPLFDDNHGITKKFYFLFICTNAKGLQKHTAINPQTVQQNNIIATFLGDKFSLIVKVSKENIPRDCL